MPTTWAFVQLEKPDVDFNCITLGYKLNICTSRSLGCVGAGSGPSWRNERAVLLRSGPERGINSDVERNGERALAMGAISRRLMLTTGGAVVCVLAGAGALAWWPGTAAATEPWRDAGQSFGDIRLDALAYAILAPNPHNRQPWIFRLVGDDRVDISCDLERRLPATDPFDRQIVVGFGCVIELFCLALSARGWRTDVDLWPDGEPNPRLDERRVASVKLIRDGALPADPLYNHVLTRRSTKTVYDISRPVSASALASLMAAGATAECQIDGTVDVARVRWLRDLTWRAFLVEWETAATRRESIDLMRIGNAQVAANPDGIELGGLVMGLVGLTGMLSREGLDTPGSTAYRQSIDMFRPIMASAMGYVWVTTPDSGRSSQIAAGRSWVRVNLAAQAAGIAIHPLSQALQEFPEMAALYHDVHRQLGAVGGPVVQMLGRLGYAPFPAPTPRWPLRSHLVMIDT